MSDARRLYRSVRSGLNRLYPHPPEGNLARHLNTLAFLVSGIVRSQSSQLPSIARKVSDGTHVDSRVKRFSRWVANERIDAEVYFLPFLEPLLAGLAATRSLVLVIDGSEVGRGCITLMVSVVYQKRALPLAWITIQGNKGHFPETMHVQLMSTVHALVPEGSDVIVLGDGEFDGTTLQATLQGFGWAYVCRTAKNILLREADEWFSFADLDVQRGQRFGIPEVDFTAQAYGPVLAIAWWESQYKEPLFLVTNLELVEEACYWYAKRFRIETFFSDQKSRGFNLHKSHLSDPERLTRLMMATCLAYIWLIYLGVMAKQQGWQRHLHRNHRCDLSLFQLGLRFLDHCLNEGLTIHVAFQMPNDESVR